MLRLSLTGTLAGTGIEAAIALDQLPLGGQRITATLTSGFGDTLVGTYEDD